MKVLELTAVLALAGCTSAASTRSRRDAGTDVSIDHVTDATLDGAEAGDAATPDAAAGTEGSTLTVPGPCVDGTVCTQSGGNGVGIRLFCACHGGGWRCLGNFSGEADAIWLSGFAFPDAAPVSGEPCREAKWPDNGNFACAFPNRCGTVCSCSSTQGLDPVWGCGALPVDGGEDGGCPWSICEPDSGASWVGACDGSPRCFAVSCRFTNPCSGLYGMGCDVTIR